MPASEKELGDLHKSLTQELTATLRGREVSEETTDADGVVTVTKKTVRATAAEMAVAAKFLKDNAITVSNDANTDLKDLREQLAAKAPNKRDLQDAMKQLGGGLLN